MMPTAHPTHANLVDVLHHHAQATPDRMLYRFVGATDADDEPVLSYADLDRSARRIAAALQTRARKGDVALLLYPPGLPFIEAFMGCLYAGVIAVPVYLPNTRSESWERLSIIANDAGATLLLTDGAQDEAVERWFGNGPPSGMSALDTVALEHVGSYVAVPLRADDIAFLQYTSGSTGDPKGVMVSHGNLIANQALIKAAFGNDASDIVAGWLPQYHDMGLIGNILQPLYLGATAILMQPLTFLQDPGRWLEVISRYRATISGGPDFAYRLCARRIDPTRRQAWDLSHWRVAFNGAEPVSPDTLHGFTQAFAPHGFHAGAFYPCYGLAEGTLLVTGSSPGRGAVTLDVLRDALEAHRAEPSAGADTVSLAGAGRADDERVRIVDPVTNDALPDGSVGEVWATGASVTRGYWKRDAINEAIFRARIAGEAGTWLRTGDLGFVHEGELFVTGRLKDLIIVRGRNYYPQDIEASLQQAIPAFREGCGAAFAVTGDDGEALVLVQELERSAVRRASHADLFAEASAHVADRFGLRLRGLALVKPATVPKTSSGKLRRSTCRASWMAGTLPGVVAIFDGEGSRSVDVGAAEDSTPLDVIARVLGRDAAHLAPDLALTSQGLDSLRAAELEYLFAQRFGRRIDMGELLAGMTLADALASPTTQEEETAITRPASSFQGIGSQREAIWRAQAMYPTSAAHTISAVFDVVSPIDEALLAHALKRLVERHPLLVTTYVEHDGDLRDDVGSGARAWRYTDASQWNPEDIDAFLRNESARRIDLAHGPIFAVHLLRRPEGTHTLQCLVHHIAVDAHAMRHLLKSLFDDYRDLGRGVVQDIASSSKHLEYEAERESWLASAPGQQAKQRYIGMLGTTPPILALPSDRRRPARFDFAGAELAVTLPAEDVDALIGATGATAFHVLLSAWAIVLRRLGGQDRFVVGVPVSDRPTGGHDDTVGCFVDMKQVPCEIRADDEVIAVIDRVRRTMLDILALRAVPTHRATRERAARTDWASSVAPNLRFALLQSVPGDGVEPFLMNMHGAPIVAGGLTLCPRPIQASVAPADLALTVARIGDTVQARFVYASSVFSASRIEAIAAMFQQALISMRHMPSATVTRLPLLAPDERARQLALSAATPVAAPVPACVHERIETMAKRFPDATAVIHDDAILSYAQLDDAASRLARTLVRLGVGIEDRVALYLRRSVDTVIAFLATLKAGACSVMLEPSLPVDRCRYILGDASTRLVLTNLDDLSLLDPGDIPVLDVRRPMMDDDQPLPAIEGDGGRAAYVLYTSGSTGRPKGVIGLHRAIANRTEWMIRHFGLAPGDRVLHTTPLGFVRAEREILYPLCAGATLVFQAEDGLHRPDRILDALERHDITSTASSPSLLRMILDHDGARFGRLPHLRRWFIGADILQADLVHEVQAIAPCVALSYFYGSTEVASDVACFDVPSPYLGTPQLPAGRALSNTSLYILDPHGEPCPPGMAGELYVGGVQLARGYVGDDALTASRFVDDPFQPGERVYRTGDLAWRNEEGLLVVNGRADDQLSIDGHRVEPGEVEHAIRRLPGIRDAVVMPSAREEGRRTLIAYVAGIDTTRARTLRSELRAQLPAYMIPGLFVPVSSLPVTALGKIDRAALNALDLDAYTDRPTETAASPWEATMAGILAELCGIPSSAIDVTSNFADIGASSVVLGQFVRRLNAIPAPRPIGVTDVYEYPGIRLLAQSLERAEPPEVVAVEAATSRADARRAAMARRGNRTP